MLDVFQTDISLAIANFRISFHNHLNNFLTVVLWDQNSLFFVVRVVLAYLLLKLFRKTNRIKLTSFIVDLGVKMPGFIVGLHDLSGFLTIINCLVKVFSRQICNCRSHCDLRGWCSIVLNILSLDLLILIIEMPLSEFEITVTKLFWVLDLLVVDHLFKHLDCTFLFIVVIIILEDRQAHLWKVILNVLSVSWGFVDLLLFQK